MLQQEPQFPAKGRAPKSPGSGRVGRMAASPVRTLLALTDGRLDVISLAGGLPASDVLDLPGISAAFEKAFTLGGRAQLQYSPTEGNASLRRELARRMHNQGITATPDEVLVTSGAQQALFLAAAVLLDETDTVLVEEPTYLAALQCFQLFGARVVGVRSDAGGIDVEALEKAAARERPTVLYLVPTFANPTGRTISAQRRAAVVDIANQYGIWIVEDDPYSELRFRGDPVAPIAASTAGGSNAIYCGSLSKVCAPGLRLGWLHGPHEFLDAAAVAKQAVDLHSSTIDQAAAAYFLAGVDMTPLLDSARHIYRERRDALLGELERLHLPSSAEWTDPDGGMFVWLRLGGDIDTGELLSDAIGAGVAFVPGAPFYAGSPDRSTMRLSFASQPPPMIRTGVQRLGAVLRSAGV